MAGQRLLCLAQGHNAVTPVKLETSTLTLSHCAPVFQSYLNVHAHARIQKIVSGRGPVRVSQMVIQSSRNNWTPGVHLLLERGSILPVFSKETYSGFCFTSGGLDLLPPPPSGSAYDAHISSDSIKHCLS